MGPIVRLIGSGVGLAAEAISRHRSRSRDRSGSSNSTNPNSTIPDEKAPQLVSISGEASTPRDAPPPYDGQLVEVPDERADELIASGKAVLVDENKLEASEKKPRDDDHDDSDSSTDNDEQEWTLDDAAHELESPATPPIGEEPRKRHGLDATYTIESLCATTLAKCPPISTGATSNPLPYPVIIPQRRPGTRNRGYIHAYPPILESKCLPQDAFLTFLSNLYESSQVSPFLNVVWISADVVGVVPSPFAMIGSIVVKVAAGAAMALQAMQRTSSYLDEMNAKVFMPRGLFALIMAYRPEGERPVDAQSVDTAKLISKRNAPHNKMNIRPSTSAKTYGNVDLPEAAPLIFPALDQALTEGGEEERNKLKGSMNFVADYYDRRAQASYNKQNPDSKLAVPQEASQSFAHSLSDPNHPAFRGSLATLLSGGKIPPKKERKAARAAKKGKVYDPNAPHGPIGYTLQAVGLRGKARRMKENVLYLLIVNLPSVEELEEANKQLQEAKKQSKWNFGSKGGTAAERYPSAGGVEEVNQKFSDTKME